LRLILSGSAPLHQHTLDLIGALSTARVLDDLGFTEGTGANFFSDPSLHRASVFVHGGHAVSAVAQTVDEADDVLTDGSIGRLRIYSDRLMSGYLDAPEQTARALRGGWLYTGDMTSLQPDGAMRIAGRAVEMIKSAWGDIVFPSEIETALLADGRVREVTACSFSDADGIERIAAFVVPSNPPRDAGRLGEDLKDHVRRVLGDSKVPGVVVLISEIPRVGNEKPDKRALLARYIFPGRAANG
jgi:acyl-CoA synthetase (AMP-forming)/AMP-acid ligase II